MQPHVTSDGTPFGPVDPGLLAELHRDQNLLNTNMMSLRLHAGRKVLAINFHTQQHMPAVYLAAGTFPDLASVEVLTPRLVTVMAPYRTSEDVDRFRKHFRDLWQMTRSV